VRLALKVFMQNYGGLFGCCPAINSLTLNYRSSDAGRHRGKTSAEADKCGVTE